MTVAKLITLLSKFPENHRVVVSGYEDGFDDIDSLSAINIKDFEPAAWYYGRYDQAEKGGEPAVLLVRQQSMEME